MATTQKAVTVTGITKDALMVIGADLASKFNDADSKASETKRKALLVVAKKHAGDKTHIPAILEGYANRYAELGMSDSIIKVRKAEAKAVFDAVAKSEVSSENLDKLEAFEGGYNEFISLARKLKGEVKRDNQQGRTRTKTELTGSQYESTETRITEASPVQVVELAETGIKSMFKLAAPELAGYQTLLLIQSAATALAETDGVEEPFKQAAEKILAITEKSIEQAQKARKITADMAEASKQGTAVEVTQ